MIDIQINPRQFEYDVQSMVQALCGTSFKINSSVDEVYRRLYVEFLDESMCVRLNDENKELFREQIGCEFLKNKDISKLSGSERRDTKMP